MAAHLSTSATNTSARSAASIREIPKSNVFTSHLPPDEKFPTPQSSHSATREKLGPRIVKNAMYTFIRPEGTQDPELLAVSKAALKDLGIQEDDVKSPDFLDTVSGNKIIAWDEEKQEGVYPWAQCYGGYQFGQWAGQLGDGRAISLFETTNPAGTRYEVQLKGAGMTPYSRFADGKAVFRSSLREFVVSEYLNAIGIKSTRALSLTYAPKARVVRERIEPGSIVARFAQTWLRLGTFDLLRARGDRKLLRQLADYVAEHVFGGWDNLPAKLPAGEVETTATQAISGVSKDTIEGAGKDAENRYTRLYRHIVRLNAQTVAWWQAYGFMNGVLNTDNTSVLGLSIDFGPFAFMDQFDPSYTPNHDDHMLRYSYRNQPTIIWWNLVRTGEAFGELIGSGAQCDDQEFVDEGVRKEAADELVSRAENLIEKIGEEFKAVFMAEYKKLMTARLGLKTQTEGDFKELYSELLDAMEALELDFNQTFRCLSGVRLADVADDEKRKETAKGFFHPDGVGAGNKIEDGQVRLSKWLEKWSKRVIEDWGEGKDAERSAEMRMVNPKFVPRSWILDEIIERVEKQGERGDLLEGTMKMALNPFEDSWSWDNATEERWCGPVPKYKGLTQCSCSS
ncbi:YdiU domain protein [Pseudovirgaria hyperparasitica]|uniref:Selenoprotein O n=1 Tax=Pseudovirgaria hyperparasitica TaxID=470096 RepID=A0A6A6VWP4_9PEZI|nr:YdiU domain protein [Pseudovirgaria hyperparasitica]KAF2755108.1 YdiU domain protein [Pseudovirgaria hyperparasitica]